MTARLATSLLSVLCLTNTAYGNPEKPSLIDSFSGFYNGYFDNVKQLEGNTGNHLLIQVRLVPVLVPQLQQEPMIFIEESLDGRVYRMGAGRLKENGENNTVSVELFVFMGFSQLKPNEFDVKNLANFKRKDFVVYGQCPQIFIQEANRRFTGIWTDCGRIVDGTHPRYEITVFCHGITFLVTTGALENATTVPYNLKLEGVRFPLIGSDYEAKCHD